MEMPELCPRDSSKGAEVLLRKRGMLDKVRRERDHHVPAAKEIVDIFVRQALAQVFSSSDLSML